MTSSPYVHVELQLLVGAVVEIRGAAMSSYLPLGRFSSTSCWARALPVACGPTLEQSAAHVTSPRLRSYSGFEVTGQAKVEERRLASVSSSR